MSHLGTPGSRLRPARARLSSTTSYRAAARAPELVDPLGCDHGLGRSDSPAPAVRSTLGSTSPPASSALKPGRLGQLALARHRLHAAARPALAGHRAMAARTVRPLLGERAVPPRPRVDRPALSRYNRLPLTNATSLIAPHPGGIFL